MTRQLFQHHSIQLSYIEWGHGHEVILCFHGFGREASDFKPFQKLLSPHQRLIAVDLIAHGESRFLDHRDPIHALRPQEWVSLLNAFLEDRKIDQFHLLGYSIGGRIALCTWQWMPEKVKSVLLLAPDGLKKNKLYQFTSGTSMGRALYRYFVRKPQLLFATAGFLHRVQILHPKLHRFVHVHLDSEAKRQLVYDAWLAYRAFFPHLKKLSLQHQKSMVPLTMIFGKNDSIIRPQLAKKLTRLFKTHVNVIEMNAGHRLLNDDLIALIRSTGCWPK
jgi:pimeloyl-ACP methyl ester carboxylesterase